jgi:hypothetical protein
VRGNIPRAGRYAAPGLPIGPPSAPAPQASAEGEGVDRDLGAEAFLLRRLWASFPFSSIGAGFRAFLGFEVWPDFLAAFAMPQIIAPAYHSHYRSFMGKFCWDYHRLESTALLAGLSKLPNHSRPGTAHCQIFPVLGDGYAGKVTRYLLQ